MQATNPDPPVLSRATRAVAGALSGALAGIVMTTVMLLLASVFAIATPLVIMGDRLSVFIPVDAFLELMGKVGGYNRMKQLGVASVMLGQILVGAAGGAFYGLIAHRFSAASRRLFSAGVFILLPLIAVSAALWPVLGTHYGGLPIWPATLATIFGLLAAFVAFERVLVLCFAGLTGRARSIAPDVAFTPPIGRRALVLGSLGLLVAGGGAAVLRKLYKAATFSYDGLQYKGEIVQPITPNDQFYCVTKNVVDPMVDDSVWRLEVTGLVSTPRRYRIEELRGMEAAVTQETTLMCISNGLDAGLISNALWKGVPMRTFLEAAGPLASGVKVKLHGVDNYTDTIPVEKALDLTTLIAYEMNGEPLPQRHGFPARAIVPGYFGEKHVKWITRIELAGSDAVGFYEKQGWGPNFMTPIRTRVDQPHHDARIALRETTSPLLVKGMAFAGDRGVARVEFTSDDGATWSEATLDYPGPRLSWTLWSYQWRPAQPGDYVLFARAMNRDGQVQEWDPNRPFKSGATGFHKIVVHITA